mgnify:CR=1 FL=1
MPFLITGPAARAKATLLLAPGAGAPATSVWMETFAAMLAEARIRALRFDFAYMAERQRTGSRRPPPKAETLMAEYAAAVPALKVPDVSGPLLIGGKSLGGRVASLIAQSEFASGRIAGLVCLGYPFHPPKQPEKLRTAHLLDLTCPSLIVQGERDPFGGPQEVAAYGLADGIRVCWARDGDHDLAPRRSSGATLEGNLSEAVQEIARFAEGLAQS